MLLRRGRLQSLGDDALDVLDPLAGQGRQRQPDRHDHLPADGQVELEQEVVVLADRTVDDVLDGDDAGGRVAGRHRLEDGPEAGQRCPRHVTEGDEDRVLGERTGLAGIGNGSVSWHRGSMPGAARRDQATVAPKIEPTA